MPTARPSPIWPPEYGATCGLFTIDDEKLHDLHLTGRLAEQVALVEAYARRQGLFRVDGGPHANYSKVIELDQSTIEPILAGPKRPKDRIALTNGKQTIVAALHDVQEERGGRTSQDRDLARFADEGGGMAVAIYSTRGSSSLNSPPTARAAATTRS